MKLKLWIVSVIYLMQTGAYSSDLGENMVTNYESVADNKEFVEFANNLQNPYFLAAIELDLYTQKDGCWFFNYFKDGQKIDERLEYLYHKIRTIFPDKKQARNTHRFFKSIFKDYSHLAPK